MKKYTTFYSNNTSFTNLQIKYNPTYSSTRHWLLLISETISALKRPSSILWNACSFWKRRAYKERNVFSHSTNTPGWASSTSPTAPQVYGFPELVATSVLDNIVSEFRLLFQAISGGANRDAIDAVASSKPSLSLSLLAAFLFTSTSGLMGKTEAFDRWIYQGLQGVELLLLPSSHCCQCSPELF